MPHRVQLSRKKGWRMPPNTVKVDRSTKWGNPFVVGVHGTRPRCLELFRLLVIGGYICVTTREHMTEQETSAKHIRKNLATLKGKDLACWCPLSAPCHADVLLYLANSK